ncbi:hypothetical protein [Pedobacter boryungensis]|uniref:Uncharacterized protein n=1 Tax=Pedobacter boryungensis TaxID=869962 RepID=A0ABX2DCS7_9SPHI|nr:hypothetical protein [Pedobacter boryungensis]NQX31892.1 hypothetical protein [Pedobacter boryungensis]
MKKFLNSISFLLTLILLSIVHKDLKAQEDKNLYFLADTVNIPKDQRLLNINKSVPFTLYEKKYEFFCKCLPPFKQNLMFFYINTQRGSKEEIFYAKPIHNYLSWQELMALIEKHQNAFDQKYNLYIVEVLPGKRYKMNLVKLAKYSKVE